MPSLIPAQYQWLLKETGPKMLTEALKLVGVREIVGKEHNPVILKWAKEVGVDGLYKSDETAWCGLSHAVVIKRANKPLDLKSWDILRALQYVKFGIAVEEPMLADTLIFKRPGGGHVGLYIAESETTYHVLGGNQNNSYGFTEIEKDRLYAARRPVYKVQPANVRKIFVDSFGNLSHNEK